MGLYLCIFDEGDEEVDGVEVGLYADFGDFRAQVVEHVENGTCGSACLTLTLHSDCEGEWCAEETERLESELLRIRRVFRSLPPIPLKSTWKAEVAKKQGIGLKTLDDCFFDIDGENLIDRLIGLCKTCQRTGHPVLFQ